MCRLIAYLGSEILLEEVLVKPTNSLIMQSLHARESNIRTNGDGFGVGWYAPDISHEPALFTSILPAWNDRNLLSITSKIKSNCFFSHVRASSVGGVTTFNCHPFVHGRLMMMHNGDIHNFITLKRHIRHLLEDDIYHWVKGETDSEHFFALFLQLAKGKDMSNMDVVADVFQTAINEILRLVQDYGTHNNSYFNICITDGKRMLASRYCSNKNNKPETLHYFKGKLFHASQQSRSVKNIPPDHRCVLIASEKLTNYKADWQEVPANHLLMVDYDHHIKLRPLD